MLMTRALLLAAAAVAVGGQLTEIANPKCVNCPNAPPDCCPPGADLYQNHCFDPNTGAQCILCQQGCQGLPIAIQNRLLHGSSLDPSSYGILSAPTMSGLFSDIPDSIISNLEPWLDGSMYISLHGAQPAGYSYEFIIKDVTNFDYVDLFLFVYRCNPCPTTNGAELHRYLTTNGWKKHNCGPTFQFADGKHQHPFHTYHMEASAKGNAVGISSGDLDINFAFLVVSGKHQLCSDVSDQYTCDGYHTCQWGSWGCEPSWCPPRKPYTGPSFGCTTCAMGYDWSYTYQ